MEDLGAKDARAKLMIVDAALGLREGTGFDPGATDFVAVRVEGLGRTIDGASVTIAEPGPC